MGYRNLPPAAAFEPFNFQIGPADPNSKLLIPIPANTMTDSDVLVIDYAGWNVVGGGAFYMDLSINGTAVLVGQVINGTGPDNLVSNQINVAKVDGVLYVLMGAGTSGSLWTDASGWGMSESFDLAFYGEADVGGNFMLRTTLLRGIA